MKNFDCYPQPHIHSTYYNDMNKMKLVLIIMVVPTRSVRGVLGTLNFHVRAFPLSTLTPMIVRKIWCLANAKLECVPIR